MWQQIVINKPAEKEIIATTFANKAVFITTINGKLFCADNICPHDGVPLNLGCIIDNCIKCSLHGFSFNLTTGVCSESGIDNLNIYDIKIENNKIWLKS